MYTDIVLIVVLVALIYHTPGVIASLSTTLLGKLLLTWTTLSLAVFRGRNAGVLGALITILLQYRGTREGLTSPWWKATEVISKEEIEQCGPNDSKCRKAMESVGTETVGTETVDDLKCENDDCSDNIIEEDIEGAGKEGYAPISPATFLTQRGRKEDTRIAVKDLSPTSRARMSSERESFLGSGQICSVLASSRLSLEEALRSIGSNKLPVPSARGNGGKNCPLGTICPQSTDSVKCGFFS